MNNVNKLHKLISNSILASFVIFTDNINIIDKSISSICLCLRITNKYIPDISCENIILQHVIKIYKKPKLSIIQIKELVYNYNCISYDSSKLQRLIYTHICNNINIPINIKYSLTTEVSTINHLYAKSYVKNIYLEWYILAIYKHIKDYVHLL